MVSKSHDLNDSLDDLIGAPRTATKVPPASYQPIEKRFEEPCPKCRGTGHWRGGYTVGACFKCNGTGKLVFATSAADRAKGRVQSTQRKATKAANALETFKAEYPDIWAWMDGSTFGFAVSLRDAVAKYGSLTDNQIAAARRAIEKLNAAKQAAVERKANAPVVDTSALEAAFSKAAAKLQRPKLRLAGFTISRAKPDSANPGALYIKGDGGLYLGKIAGGKFVRSRECSTETEKQVLDVALDPKGAAIAYGKLYGNCAVCSRQLTDPVSVANGIGPVCAENFGW